MSLPLLLLALKFAASAAAAKAFPAALDIDRPPADLAALVRQVRDADPAKREAAARRLGERDDAAPYVRDLFFGRMHIPQPCRAAILADLDARRHARNAARALRWADQRRADMLAEYGSMGSADDQLPGQLEPVFRLNHVISAEFQQIAAEGSVGRGSLLYPAAIEPFLKGLTRHSGDWVVLGPGTKTTNSRLIQANRCDDFFGGRTNCIVLVRDDLRDSVRTLVWHNSVALLNHARPLLAEFSTLNDSLLVVDGDVDLAAGSASLDDSVLIANGVIRAGTGPVYLRRSYLWAAAGIELPRTSVGGDDLLASGGRITVAAGGAGRPGRVKENLPADPLGFRFFELADVGLAVAEWPGGVTITRVGRSSRFAAFDVRARDVVTRVNGTRIDSAREFRRQVRQAVVAEHGVFHLRRGGEPVNRVVVFRDVALPR